MTIPREAYDRFSAPPDYHREGGDQAAIWNPGARAGEEMLGGPGEDPGRVASLTDHLGMSHKLTEEMEELLRIIENRIEGPSPVAGSNGKPPPPPPVQAGVGPMVADLVHRQELILKRLHNVLGRI